MDGVMPLSMDAARPLSMDAARPLSMDEARLLSMDVGSGLSMDASRPNSMYVARPLLMGDYCVSVGEETKNNQPNLLMNANNSFKPHSGPTNYQLLQKNKQRNYKDMKNNLFETKTANFDRSCLCCVLNHKKMEKLRSKGMVFIDVKTPV